MSAAYRRREQDMIDAQHQISVELLRTKKVVKERELAGMVQKRSSEITEARGGW